MYYFFLFFSSSRESIWSVYRHDLWLLSAPLLPWWIRGEISLSGFALWFFLSLFLDRWFLLFFLFLFCILFFLFLSFSLSLSLLYFSWSVSLSLSFSPLSLSLSAFSQHPLPLYLSCLHPPFRFSHLSSHITRSTISCQKQLFVTRGRGFKSGRDNARIGNNVPLTWLLSVVYHGRL